MPRRVGNNWIGSILMFSKIPVIETKRLILTVAGPECVPFVKEYMMANRDHFRGSRPDLPEDAASDSYWHAQLAQQRDRFSAGSAVYFTIFERHPGPVLGDCNFTYIVRGPLQACYLGYKLDRDAVGKGIMTEALTAAIGYMFEHVKLHRIMANYRPGNERSGRVLRRLGFTVEGFARDYLFLDGAWQDHILTALVNPNPTPPSV